MLRVFDCVTTAHDPQILILAFLFCVFASSTAMVIAQRGIAASGATQLGWLVAAGVVTGVCIWTTHFFGMARTGLVLDVVTTFLDAPETAGEPLVDAG